MKLVFDHIDYTIVGHLQGLMEAEGIKTELRNLEGSSAAGGVPFTQVYPELWVLNNGDEARAKAIVKEFRSAADAEKPGPAWTCPVCKEQVEGMFSECWNCGASAPPTQ